MHVSKELLKVLHCPFTKQKLIYDKERQELVSPVAEVSFPIVDGIPIVLKEEARQADKERVKWLIEQDKIESAHDPLKFEKAEIGQEHCEKAKEKCL